MAKKIEIELSDKHMDVKDFNGLLAGQMTIMRDLQRNYIGSKSAEESKSYAKSELEKRIEFTGNASDETKEKALNYLTLDVVSKALGNKGLYAEGGGTDGIKNLSKERILNICEDTLEKYESTKNDVIDTNSIRHEMSKDGDLNFFYFESRNDKMMQEMKRYYMVVKGYEGFQEYFYDSNAIDSDKSYSIDDVKQRFKGYINGLSKKIDYADGGETDDFGDKITHNREVVKLTPIYTKRDAKGFRFYSTDDGNTLYAEKKGEIYNVSEETLKPTGVIPLHRSRFKFVGLIDDADVEGMNPLHYEREAVKRAEKSFGLEDGGETDDDDMEEDENQKRLEELADEYDIPTEVIEQYASDMGIEISEINDLPYNGRYDSEEAYAEQMVDDGVITDLSYYLEMYPTDMRILAQEEADRRVDDLDDDDILREADMEDEANEYNETKDEIDVLEDEISDLKSEIDDLFEDEDEDTTEGELEEKEQKAKELREELQDKENELEGLHSKMYVLDSYDEVVDKAREELREQYYDDIHDALEKDAVGYFVDELGYNVEDLAKNNLFTVDYEKLARELGYDVNYIEHDGDVYVFSNYERGGMTYAKGGEIKQGDKVMFRGNEYRVTKITNENIVGFIDTKWYLDSDKIGVRPIVLDSPKEIIKLADGGMMAKGGNIPTIEKRVAEVNALIKEGNEKGVEVIDSSSTWESPMKYKPLKYSNGVLYIEYEELDLYKYNKGMGTEWKTKKDKIAKSGIGVDDQKETLTYIARMYRKAIKHFDTYGYADGGEVSKKEMLDYLNMYFDYYSELRTIAVEEDNILTKKMLPTLDDEQIEMAYEDARYEIRSDLEGYGYSKGGEVLYLESDGTSQRLVKDKSKATPMWIMDAEYYVKSQNKNASIEKIDKSLPDRVGRNYIVVTKNKMVKGGKVKFEDKVSAISKSLLERKKVSPSVQKDYGKTYSKKEAVESAKRIAGAMRKKEMAKKKS